ncbi:MAG TPA: 1-acyl-sn-glycerol-3-phosphate acyltransferase [Kineosporiaceae bacterium]|nr:1-acyl-sn-glycerol-3-phosphate acyltransferase [Kineosporiaceae bacterium]
MLPPWWVRRLLLVPAMLVTSVVAVLTLPLTAVVAGLLGLLSPRTWSRPLRLLLLVVGYLAAEGVGLIALGVLWVIAGFGRSIRDPASERRHYVLVRTYLEWLYWLVKRVLRVSVRVAGPAPEAYRDRPLIVFCRHAGPGDSFLIVHALLDWYDREPRIVLKDTLQWDPAIDVVLNRLPNRFIRSGSPGLPTVNHPEHQPPEQVIGELARKLDGNDALVLFPEGGNFTARRRVRAIQRLRKIGLHAEVRKAEAMRHVLPPRPAGVLAVLANAGDADVVWVGHTGTDHLLSVADLWAAVPMDTEILMRWWHVSAKDVPLEPDAQIDWLYEWWKQIDDWIAVNRPPR